MSAAGAAGGASPEAPAVAPGDDLRRVVTLFLERGVDVLRCVDAGGHLIGVVTRDAVAARLAAPADGNGAGAPTQ
jgi:CBS domain-containing protein